MSAADQPSARPAEHQAFDLSRMSEQEVAAEIERRVTAFKLARHAAPERTPPLPPTELAPRIEPPRMEPTLAAHPEPAQTEPAQPERAAPPPVVPAIAPPDLPPIELSPTDLPPHLGEAPPPFDRVMALRRRGRALAGLPIGTEEDALDFTPDFSALLEGKDDIALDLGTPVAPVPPGRAAATAATRPRPPIEFRTGFFSGLVTALVLAAGGIGFWSFGGEDPVTVATISHDAPAARPTAPLAELALAPTHTANQVAGEATPRAASPVERAPESGPEIRTAAASVVEESDAPRLAPILKPAVQQAAAAPKPAAKPKPAPELKSARNAAGGPFDPLLDFLEPLTSQIDRSATPPAPRPENQGKRGD